MNAYDYHNLLKEYNYKIKKNIFSKPEEYHIKLYKDFLSAKGYIQQTNNFDKITTQPIIFKIKFDEINNIEFITINDTEFFKIELISLENDKPYYLLPIIKEIDNIKETLLNLIEAYTQTKINQLEVTEKNLIIEKERKERILNKKQESIDFFNNTYNRHITETTPKYVFETGENRCTLLYIDKDKNIVFLVINGDTHSEVYGTINYNDIHYYEKAGTIHYVPEINVNYQESNILKGSFITDKYKDKNFGIGLAILGGLLFGTMGMLTGAIVGTDISHNNSEYIPPKYIPSNFEITSNTVKIDERSVILNYFSLINQQYIDIELPKEIYNFFQTHLSEKKYGIVIEIEKKEVLNIINQPMETLKSSQNPTIDSPKERLMKLKELHDCDLISAEEFNKRKAEIIERI